MTNKDDCLEIKDNSLETVGDFLSLFYYEEPDDINASIEVLTDLIHRLDYRYDLIVAFKKLLTSSLPERTLTELVKLRANRYVENDEEAKEFLQRVWTLNLFDLVA